MLYLSTVAGTEEFFSRPSDEWSVSYICHRRGWVRVVARSGVVTHFGALHGDANISTTRSPIYLSSKM